MCDRIYNGGPDKLRSPERLKRLEIESVVAMCRSNDKTGKLLDIGTGSGVFAEAFFNSGLEVSGIDINSGLLEVAKIHLPQSNFQIAPAEDIPFDDNSFDTTFFGLVFHEVADYKKALSEAFRVSQHNTYILEWQYKTEEFGPPINHRLNAEFINNLSLEIGFVKCTEQLLTNLVQIGRASCRERV